MFLFGFCFVKQHCPQKNAALRLGLGVNSRLD